jgi:hypothetical protein
MGQCVELNEIVTLQFNGVDFAFRVSGSKEQGFSGNFIHEPGSKARLTALFEEEEEWFLAADGNRLSDELLLAASPWCLVRQPSNTKIIMRWYDLNANFGQFSFVAPIQLTQFRS